MIVFTYKAYNENGGVYYGKVEANSDSEAKLKLIERGVQLVFVKKRLLSNRRKISLTHVLSFTKDLAELIEADLPLFESLTLLKEQTSHDALEELLSNLIKDLESGASFSSALEKYPKTFSQLYCSLVHVGEQSGELYPALTRIIEEYERQNKLLAQIKSALIYPSLLMVFCFILIHLIAFFLIPSLDGLLDPEKGHIMTRLVIYASSHLRRFELFYFAALTSLFLLIKWKLKRAYVDTLLMKVPKVSVFIIEHTLLKFASTMEILLSGGIPLLESLKLTRSLITNAPMQNLLQTVEKRVEEGHKLSSELKKYSHIPSLFTRLLLIGENSGELDKSFAKLSHHYQESVEKKLKKLMTLLSPLLLLIMGVIIGFIMLGILIPLTDINSLSL